MVLGKTRITQRYGSPNITLLLPGGCDAHCGFCFWDRGEAKIRPPDDYLERVRRILLAFPAREWPVLSLSGGEPTQSPWFVRVLDMLAGLRCERSFARVVLTSHGGRVGKHLGETAKVVNHLNISRHAVGTDANRKAFRSPKILSDEALALLIARVHGETLMDVTLNCVVAPEVSIRFCREFLAYARGLGADGVSFRKEASDVSPTAAEEQFRRRYGVVEETQCPVCRGMVQDVDGFRVSWKGTVAEPSVQTGGIYEAVIHPDGAVYADWRMKVPILFAAKPKRKNRAVRSRAPKVQSESGGGGYCGGGGCHGGCG